MASISYFRMLHGAPPNVYDMHSPFSLLYVTVGEYFSKTRKIRSLCLITFLTDCNVQLKLIQYVYYTVNILLYTALNLPCTPFTADDIELVVSYILF